MDRIVFFMILKIEKFVKLKRPALGSSNYEREEVNESPSRED